MTPELLTAAAILYASFGRDAGYSHAQAVKDARTLAALILNPEKEPVAASFVADGEET